MTRPTGPTIVGLEPYRGGCTLTVRCASCANEHTVEQEGIGGIAFGRHQCPHCATPYEVGPEQFVAAVVERYGSDLTRTAQETELATELTERWHRSPAFSELLRYRGVELGPPTERELLASISEALRRSSDGDRG